MHNILIVDDEPSVLDTVSNLIDARYPATDITKANNGLDAFIATQQKKFDIIITDHKMPFMTGAAFVIAVRTKENLNTSTPMVMLSACIDHGMRKSLSIQNVKFVEKPFTPDDFLDILRTYLM